MRFVGRGVAALALGLAMTAPAMAQTGLAPQAATPQLVTPPADQGWRFAVDAGYLLGPVYPGSDSYRGVPLLTPDIRYGQNTFFANFRDGVGFTAFRAGGFSTGPLVRVRLGRDQDANKALQGMGDIDASAEAGVFLNYNEGPWRMNAELRAGFGGHSGLLVDLRADRVFMVRPDLFLSAGPRLSWGSKDFAETYFGVDASQASRTGYAQFSPDNYWFAAVGASASYRINDRWGVTAFGEIGQIFGPAADSPLVEGRGSATQGVVGLAVRYRFSP